MRGGSLFSLVTSLMMGCGFQIGIGGAPAGDATDAPIVPDADNPIIDAPASNCVGSAASATGQICFSELPIGAITISDDVKIDTVTSEMCATNVVSANPSPTAYCVIAGSAISIEATLVATGSRPLVLVSTSTITVMGEINVSSSSASNRAGAGSHPTACTTGGAATGGAGGAGGSFGSLGAAGGASQDPTGVGGTAAPIAIPTTLRGGCDGGTGAGASGGVGGRGGGAVGLVASGSITIDGTVNASGGGGAGPSNFMNQTIYGAGGGGSGGMIVFDAPTVAGSGANIFANGGGGGEGSQYNVTGRAGDDPNQPDQAAAGGAGGADPYGGDGGDGAFETTPAGVGDDDAGMSYGGGAGGGGVGVIKRYQAPALPGTVSPAAS